MYHQQSNDCCYCGKSDHSVFKTLWGIPISLRVEVKAPPLLSSIILSTYPLSYLSYGSIHPSLTGLLAILQLGLLCSCFSAFTLAVPSTQHILPLRISQPTFSPPVSTCSDVIFAMWFALTTLFKIATPSLSSPYPSGHSVYPAVPFTS